MRLATTILFAMTLGSLGCAAGADHLAGSPGGAGGDDSSGTDAGAGGSGQTSGGLGGSGGVVLPAGAGTGGAATGNELVCDGIDNDQNGIIDDVDKGKDGVCDCLRIATLGAKGKWGQGDVFAAWLAARSDFGAVPLAGQELTPALLDQYEVIVAQDLSVESAPQAPEIAAMKAWVESGGGLMTLIGYEDPYSINNVNKLLMPLGVNYGSQQILPSGNGTVPITNWSPHPVTEGVSLIGVRNGYPVQGLGMVLATEGGHNVLQASTVGTGHVLMWADEWITYDTEWTSHPEYQLDLFWLNMIKWLTPADRCQVPTTPEID